MSLNKMTLDPNEAQGYTFLAPTEAQGVILGRIVEFERISKQTNI